MNQMRELLDTDGENRAVRAFLMLYSSASNPGPTAAQMAAHMRAMGFDVVPDWVTEAPGHLTKGGAQLWLRMLFALEQPAERVPLIREQVDACWDGLMPSGHGKSRYDIARAIEQAHGIKPLNAQVTGPAGPNRSSDGNQ